MVVILSPIRLRFHSTTVLLFALSSILMLSVSASSNREVANSTISEAEHSVAHAYVCVLDAERAGANVSGLLVRLNDAAGLLLEARMAFEVGSFEEAIRFAELSREVGREAESEAERLEVEASYARVNTSWQFIAMSVLGVSIVLCASLLGYRYFKRRYYRRLLKLRPRVG